MEWIRDQGTGVPGYQDYIGDQGTGVPGYQENIRDQGTQYVPIYDKIVKNMLEINKYGLHKQQQVENPKNENAPDEGMVRVLRYTGTPVYLLPERWGMGWAGISHKYIKTHI